MKDLIAQRLDMQARSAMEDFEEVVLDFSQRALLRGWQRVLLRFTRHAVGKKLDKAMQQKTQNRRESSGMQRPFSRQIEDCSGLVLP